MGTRQRPRPAEAAERGQSFRACGVELELPPGWRDQTVYTFVGPAAEPALMRAAKARSELRPTLSIAEVGPMELAQAIALAPPPGDVDELTVLGEQRRAEEWGESFERIIRFADPVDDIALQQSLRLVRVAGVVYALTFTNLALEFNASYALLETATSSFVDQKLGAER